MNEHDVYYPLVLTPFGKVPLIAATMTDERERELAKKYPVKGTVCRPMKKTKSDVYCEMWNAGMSIREICEATDSIAVDVRTSLCKKLGITSTARETKNAPRQKTGGRYHY